MITLAYFIPFFRLWNKLPLLTLEIQTKSNSLYLYNASTELGLCVYVSMGVVWLILFILNTGIKICVKVNLFSLYHILHCHLFFTEIVSICFIRFMSLANICEAVRSWHYLWKPDFLFHPVDTCLCPNIPNILDAYIHIVLEVMQWVFLLRNNQKLYWCLNTNKYRTVACIFPSTVLCVYTHTHTHTH